MKSIISYINETKDVKYVGTIAMNVSDAISAKMEIRDALENDLNDFSKDGLKVTKFTPHKDAAADVTYEIEDRKAAIAISMYFQGVTVDEILNEIDKSGKTLDKICDELEITTK